MVFGLDHFEELLAQFGLLHAPQRGHGEAMFGRTLFGACAGGIVLLGPDRERAIPENVNISSNNGESFLDNASRGGEQTGGGGGFSHGCDSLVFSFDTRIRRSVSRQEI